MLAKVLAPELSCIKKYPFKELIIQAIPIHKILANTEQILLHQLLGHPCDEYLYSAHEFIDSVPKFKEHSNVLSKCSTCIHAKQTKRAPGYDQHRKLFM